MVKHYSVRGRVQGVGFRWFVHRQAAEIGLRGWVRNLKDGTVEVLAAGTEEQLARLHESLERGSRGSRVDVVIHQELRESEAAELRVFEIEGAW